ncbi:hypothetical protein PROVRUST_05277 [Providencia rustigianii DSM 4541]|uniref:Uncharacterized protein n=1 Tax=Providencia rustigianii DSM 4541 TaxID=500637 RepID=D1NYE7_9GAMM|nr:hypothetical protein PROVRUST_05277 [Providencia rustigianii DSM 4541]
MIFYGLFFALIDWLLPQIVATMTSISAFNLSPKIDFQHILGC